MASMIRNRLLLFAITSVIAFPIAAQRVSPSTPKPHERGVLGYMSASRAAILKDSGINLEGSVSATWSAAGVRMRAQRIVNTSGSTSPPLLLRLWTTSTVPASGNTIHVHVLGTYSLGELQSGFEFDNVDSGEVPYSAPAAGCYYVTVAVESLNNGGPDATYYSLRVLPDGGPPTLFSFGGAGCGGSTPGQSGVLYAVENASSAYLFRIDDFATNPQTTDIGNTGLNAPAIAIDPTSGVLYAIEPGHAFLYRLDAQSGAPTFIGDTGLAAAGLVALACDRQGRLFTWGQTDSNLYQLDPQSGAATLIGNVGYSAGGDLAFDLDGTLYGSTGTDLIRIDPQTAASSYVGSFQTTNIFGLAVSGDGTLYAGQEVSGFFTSSGQLYQANKATAQLTPVGGSLNRSIADLALFGGGARGTSSLVPFTPSGWSAPVVVSDTKGTQTDSSTLTNTEPLYVSWAIQNAGDLSTFGTFFIDLDLDGNRLQQWYWPNPLPPGNLLWIKDYQFGQLAAGTHTLVLVPDSTHVTLGSTENYTKTFTVSNAAPASLSLLFPLKATVPNRDRQLDPYTVPIITVFDHSMADATHKNRFSPYGCDLAVVAFTGERGDKKPSPSGSACSAHPGYSQSNGQPFTITGHYTGSTPDGPDYLNYEGHPGFDYAARLHTQVFASASGKIHYPITPGALQLSDPFGKYHVLEIIPDVDPSYRIYYLHLYTHPSATDTQGTYSDPSPAPGCLAQVDLPLPEGAHVNAGCLVALSGTAGARGPHLHFEVRKVLTLSGGGIAASSAMRCRADQSLDDANHACIPVDPYGWIGSYPDPYIALTGVASTYLWAKPRP
jgi:murein DD-endopeptidase MepM/ murein hydrolase activator NlpD